jgi:hypothetical protein
MEKPVFATRTARHHRGRLATVLITAVFLATASRAEDGLGSATLYGGAASDNLASQIFFHADFAPVGGMVGVAPDVKLANLGAGFTLEAEAQLTQYVIREDYKTFALGLGFRFHNFPWSDRLPTSLAIYTGPSYATTPPIEGRGAGGEVFGFGREHLLNYVGFEYAVALSHTSLWDICFRGYHRSGAWGLYSRYADEGTVMGFGIRRRF